MEESKKKMVKIFIIVICLAGAGTIMFRQHAGGDGGIDSLKGQPTWVKCTKCGASYEMDRKKYYERIIDIAGPNPSVAPPIPCNKCGEEGIYEAIKCEKCSEVFFEHADFSDICPKCGYSKIEETRKQRSIQRSIE